MSKYILLLLLTGCMAKEPIQVTETPVRLDSIEIRYRGNGDIAFLYWYNMFDKQTYLQVVSIADTVKYKPGMYRVAFIRP